MFVCISLKRYAHEHPYFYQKKDEAHDYTTHSTLWVLEITYHT